MAVYWEVSVEELALSPCFGLCGRTSIVANGSISVGARLFSEERGVRIVEGVNMMCVEMSSSVITVASDKLASSSIPLATADAYLTPCIHRYVQGFASGFQDQVT